MYKSCRLRKQQDAQTLVFFLICWGTIMLLCGLAIDSGLLYLAKARLARAVDGAALAAVGNFNRKPGDPVGNRDAVALIMRNFAAANFTDLSSIAPAVGGTAAPSGGVSSTYTTTSGTTATRYTYVFNDGVADPGGNPNGKRYVEVVLNTGSGGAITSATCNARCPVQTYFIGYATYAINGRQNVKIGGYSGPSSLADLKVSSSAVATRNPRLIMIVVDRSASMLATDGGATGLPPAIVQFLDFFDTTSDTIGIVSFGTAARLEMPMTTNFLIAGTNNLIDAYQTNSNGTNIPGYDPEASNGDANYDPNYTTTGVRRLKFGGSTAADDGIRLGLEQMMANAGFNDPDVLKYLVIFTDGKWNTARTLVAAPGYTNEVYAPTFNILQALVNKYVTNSYVVANSLTNGDSTHGPQGGGPWDVNVANNVNLLPVPTLSPMPDYTNALSVTGGNTLFETLLPYHSNDVWQSVDSSGYEPLPSVSPTPAGTVGIPRTYTNSTYLATSTNTAGLQTNYFTHNLDVWLQPGSVAYLYHNGSVSNAYISNYNNPTQHINIWLLTGDKLDLVVPGYVADGTVYDGLDMMIPDDNYYGEGTQYPRYRADNYQQAFMFTDDTETYNNTTYENWSSLSLQREMMFRNYPNLLTGFYVSRPQYPNGAGLEPLITEDASGAPRAQDGLGAYYPGAAYLWPFGGETNNLGYVTNAVGLTYDPTYSLLVWNSDPDPKSNGGDSGGSRHNAYSINMLSTNASPQWDGELFYKSVNSAGFGVESGNSSTSASQIMTTSDWKVGAPDWLTADFDVAGIMSSDLTHNTNITPNPSVWRPASYNGSNFPTSFTTSTTASQTSGLVSDGAGHYFMNAMAYSGRPTHYFDFARSSWEPIQDNHDTNQQFLPLGNWKSWEYGWHARSLGVTIYTVGYGRYVTDAQQLFLAQLANSTNTTAGGGSGSNISYNPNQPIGAQFFATNATQISNDFYSVGQAINAALTQ